MQMTALATRPRHVLLTKCKGRVQRKKKEKWMDVYKRRVYSTIHSEGLKSTISELFKDLFDSEHILQPSALKLSETEVEDHFAWSSSSLLGTHANQFFISRLYHRNGELYLKCNHCIGQK